MKRFMSIFLASAFVAGSAFAAPKEVRANNSTSAPTFTRSLSDGTNSVRGIIGFTNGAFNIGADYEKRSDESYGFGAYIFFSGEKNSNAAQKNQLITLGVNAPIYILSRNLVDIYLSPGFGVSMIKGLPGHSDETTFGPSLKTGFDYKIASNMKAGLQYFYVGNWFSDKAVDHVDYANVTYTYQF